MEPTQVNCAEACVNGCMLGDRCPNLEYQAQTANFIDQTSLDDLLALAEQAVQRRKLERMMAAEPPKWVYPEDGV